MQLTRRALAGVVAVALAGGEPMARAQPGAAPPAPAPAPAPADAAPPAAPSPPPPPPAADPARADYDDAFKAMVAGDFPRAIVGFDGVAARTTDPQLAASARELARLARELVARKVTLSAPGAAAAARAEAEAEERDSGRVSFTVWNTFYGIYGATVLDVDADVSDARVVILSLTAGAAIGLFGSYYGTKGRTMTGAMADAYSLGMIEGVGNASLLLEPLWPSVDAKQAVTTIFLSAGAVGAAGAAYAYYERPTRGQVSLASTVSILGIVSTGVGFALVQPSNLDGDTALTMLAGGLDVGLAAGFAFGKDVDWSLGRARLVQLGALLGGLTGLAAGALLTGTGTEDNDVRLMAGTTLAGMWGGLAVGIRATRGMKPDPRYRGLPDAAATTPSAMLGPMAVRHGGGLTLSGVW
jgi:hypothetical protein